MDQPKGTAFPPCLLGVPQHCKVSIFWVWVEQSLVQKSPWHPPGLPMSPCPSFPMQCPSRALLLCHPREREEKKTQHEHMWRARGNGCCKVSSAFKEVFVWGLFSYPLGNFTAEEAGPFRQWPKQYPHCLSSSRGSARLSGAGGPREDGEEKFLLLVIVRKGHGGCPVIKTLL